MDKYSCPHCEKPGISSTRASFLGPALTTKCKICGQRVGVPYWSMLTSIPMLLALLVVPRYLTDLDAVAGISVVLTALSFSLWGMVPLIKK